MKRKQPWTPSDATEIIRKVAQRGTFTLTRTEHFTERLHERDLIISDALYVLKYGFVYSNPEASTQSGLYKYRMQSKTPNSGSREVALIVIPDPSSDWMKLVTIMWDDER